MHVEVCDRRRVLSEALVVAHAVHATGLRAVIGLNGGKVRSGSFCVQFLRSLTTGGVFGVTLSISDQHEGLKHAIPASWPVRGSGAVCS
jgi:transposase-like protein